MQRSSLSGSRARHFTGALLFAASLALITPSTAFAACQTSYIEGASTVPSLTNGGAQVKARGVWQSNAWASYGAPYAQWTKAQGKQSQCYHEGKGTKRRWFCTFKAKACS